VTVLILVLIDRFQ